MRAELLESERDQKLCRQQNRKQTVYFFFSSHLLNFLDRKQQDGGSAASRCRSVFTPPSLCLLSHSGRSADDKIQRRRSGASPPTPPAARFFVVTAATRCCYVTAKLRTSVAFPGSSQEGCPPLVWPLKGDLWPAEAPGGQSSSGKAGTKEPRQQVREEEWRKGRREAGWENKEGL